VVSLRKLWDRAPHNAFTDLIRFQRNWYCAFREGGAHAGGIGRVRILVSGEGSIWKTAALLSERDVDLRDPKLSLAPDGRLMLLAGGTACGEGKPAGRQPRVSFSSDGQEWRPPRRILSEGDWLWRVTWHEGRAYGVTYRALDKRRWTITLLRSGDCLEYREVCLLNIPGKPNEATIRFRRNGDAIALVRREGGDRKGWIGASPPPHTEWRWHPTRHRFGGPNFLILPDGRMWAAGRLSLGGEQRTAIARMEVDAYEPVLELPSGGDCSYPGLAWHGGLLWVSYYSSHEGKASVYLAKVAL
jgi:hypothetical protein